MNTSRLFELKNDLRRLQHNGHTLEIVLKGYDARQKELYAETVRKQIFEIEETNAALIVLHEELKSKNKE